MTGMESCLYGVAGSVATQIAILYKHYMTRPKLPSRYGKWGFWLVLLGLFIVAGILALAFQPQNPTQAMAIGAVSHTLILNLKHSLHNNKEAT